MAISTVQRSAAARRANAHHMDGAMRALDGEIARKLAECGRIPDAWHEIARRRDEPRRERVTIALEEDVLRFYRSMGRNYAGRINEVLRAYMHARLAGLLQGAETVQAADPPRPEPQPAPAPTPPAPPPTAPDPPRASRDERMGAYLAAYARAAGPEGEEIVRRIMRDD